jgi:hypothetical protein
LWQEEVFWRLYTVTPQPKMHQRKEVAASLRFQNDGTIGSYEESDGGRYQNDYSKRARIPIKATNEP